jgi:hypothetical protein
MILTLSTARTLIYRVKPDRRPYVLCPLVSLLLTELRKPSGRQQDMSCIQFLFEPFQVRFDQRPQLRQFLLELRRGDRVLLLLRSGGWLQ